MGELIQKGIETLQWTRHVKMFFGLHYVDFIFEWCFVALWFDNIFYIFLNMLAANVETETILGQVFGSF